MATIRPLLACLVLGAVAFAGDASAGAATSEIFLTIDSQQPTTGSTPGHSGDRFTVASFAFQEKRAPGSGTLVDATHPGYGAMLITRPVDAGGSKIAHWSADHTPLTMAVLAMRKADRSGVMHDAYDVKMSGVFVSDYKIVGSAGGKKLESFVIRFAKVEVATQQATNTSFDDSWSVNSP